MPLLSGRIPRSIDTIFDIQSILSLPIQVATAIHCLACVIAAYSAQEGAVESFLVNLP